MDITLFYTEQGSGFPLILLHGNGEDQSYFVHQIEYFSRYFRVIAVDTRGHGQSPKGTAPFTISQFADDLLAFMDRLEIKKAHILGFSDGGNIALTFALRHPERVETLILNGANLNPAGMKPAVYWGIQAELAMARIKQDHYHADLMRLMLDEPNLSPGDLKGLTVPTLVIAGERDMIRDSHTRQIAASLPNAQIVILPGDHFVANKHPYDFNRAVFRFLT